MKYESRRTVLPWRLIVWFCFALMALGCPSRATNKQSSNASQPNAPAKTEIEPEIVGNADSLETYLTADGKLTQPLTVGRSQTGGASMSYQYIKVQADGKWLSGGDYSTAQHGRFKQQEVTGMLTKDELAALATTLAKNTLIDLKDAGLSKKVLDPWSVVIEFGKFGTIVDSSMGPGRTPEQEITGERILAIEQAVSELMVNKGIKK